MPQGSFTFGTSGQSTKNYANDTNFAYLGGTPYAGPPVDWTQLVIGYSGTEPAKDETQTYSSNWTISGTRGSGRILQISFYTGPGAGRHVIVTLASGGGNLTDAGGPYTFLPPYPLCFVSGTRVLTNYGYKPIETLLTKDLVVLSDGRIVDYKITKYVFDVTTNISAPYRIEAGAFGPGKPTVDICLSPYHKIQIRKGVWISPERAATKNRKVRQYGIGQPVTYFHIECGDYLKDNLVCEGIVVESLCTRKNYYGPPTVYTWSARLGGFTRPGPIKALNRS